MTDATNSMILTSVRVIFALMNVRMKTKRKPSPKFKGSGRPKELTEKQRVFIAEYLSNGQNATEAARKAQYAHPEVMGSRLRSDEFPLVQVEIGRALAKVESTALMSGQDLLLLMHRIIRFNPVEHFAPSDNPRMPGFMLAAEDFKALPDDVGELVQEAVFRKKERLDLNGNVVGTETVVYFKLMSKDEALKTAAKFQLGTLHTLQAAAPVDPAYFEQMHGKYPVGALPAHDPVEARLREAEAAADAAANRNPTITVTNGTNGQHKNGAAK